MAGTLVQPQALSGEQLSALRSLNEMRAQIQQDQKANKIGSQAANALVQVINSLESKISNRNLDVTDAQKYIKLLNEVKTNVYRIASIIQTARHRSSREAVVNEYAQFLNEFKAANSLESLIDITQQLSEFKNGLTSSNGVLNTTFTHATLAQKQQAEAARQAQEAASRAQQQTLQNNQHALQSALAGINLSALPEKDKTLDRMPESILKRLGPGWTLVETEGVNVSTTPFSSAFHFRSPENNIFTVGFDCKDSTHYFLGFILLYNNIVVTTFKAPQLSNIVTASVVQVSQEDANRLVAQLEGLNLRSGTGRAFRDKVVEYLRDPSHMNRDLDVTSSYNGTAGPISGNTQNNRDETTDIRQILQTLEQNYKGHLGVYEQYSRRTNDIEARFVISRLPIDKYYTIGERIY